MAYGRTYSPWPAARRNDTTTAAGRSRSRLGVGSLGRQATACEPQTPNGNDLSCDRAFCRALTRGQRNAIRLAARSAGNRHVRALGNRAVFQRRQFIPRRARSGDGRAPRSRHRGTCRDAAARVRLTRATCTLDPARKAGFFFGGPRARVRLDAAGGSAVSLHVRASRPWARPLVGSFCRMAALLGPREMPRCSIPESVWRWRRRPPCRPRSGTLPA
jgi:hypothetical protein